MQEDYYTRLKHAREHLEMSQSEVAEDIGVTRNDIYRYESGRKKDTPIRYLMYLAEKGVDMIWLFTGVKYIYDAKGKVEELNVTILNTITQQAKLLTEYSERIYQLEKERLEKYTSSKDKNL